MPRVDFEVTPSSGIQAFWIAVGTDDVTLVNGKGSINLQSGKHTLVWWFVGDEGDSISITGTQGGRTVVQVKQSKVPSGEHEGAGVKKFDVA
ncbi:MAG TPA: hypothetical protein VF173_37415 [Thermoanaerobaculia bacterium]|nr:hypothetical protein [Thermoanaerobaculia bacterium]